MAKAFSVARNQFPDNTTHTAFASAVKTWIDGLNIGDSDTIHEISIEHHAGFWVIVVLYEPAA